MNTPGTIDRPLTHDPQKQAPMIPSAHEPSGSATEDFTTSGANDSRQNRTREMQLIPEAMARAHMHERLDEAQRERQAVGQVTHRRVTGRVHAASPNAHPALAR